MRVYFRQIYIEPGVEFPFSHVFQKFVGNEVTGAIEASETFLTKYGSDYKLIFSIGAKKAIMNNETRGPTVFKKTKDVEYTLYLPFDAISRQPRAYALNTAQLFTGRLILSRGREYYSRGGLLSLQKRSSLDNPAYHQASFSKP